MELFFNVAMMLLKCFYIFIWIAGFKMCLCQRRIALGDKSEGKPYLVYFVKSPYSKADYDSWLCGGALVSPTQILTAAACLVEMNRIYAIAGYKKYINGKEINNDVCTKTRKQKVVKIYVPKEYKLSTNNPALWMNVDVGVAVVEKPYNFSDYTYRVDCSYEPSSIYINYDSKYEQENTHAVVFGWGGMRAKNPNDTSQLDINSKALEEASTVIVNKTTCTSPSTDAALKQIINKYLLCVSGHGNMDGDGLDKSLSSENPECPGGRRYDLTKCVDDGFDFRRQNNETRNYDDVNNDSNTAKRNTPHTRRSTSPGICQNDHGGPLIAWIGLQEIVIGVALNSIYNHNYECVGPFLYVSTAGTAKIIKCLLEVNPDERQFCNQQMEDSRYNVEEIEIKWPEDTIDVDPETLAKSQQKPMFIRQGNDESPLQMRPTKDLEPALDDLGRPLPPPSQKDDQQVYELQINQKLSQPYDPLQNQPQIQMQGQPNEQSKERQQMQPYEQVYERLYEQPHEEPTMQSYNQPKNTQQRAESHDFQQNINQPQQEPINQRQIQSMNQPQFETQKFSQGQSYNQQQKESMSQSQFESYNPPQFESFNNPQIQSFNEPQMQSFNQPQIQSFNQPQMPSFTQPQIPSFNQPQMPSYNQPQMQSFNQPQMQSFNQAQKQSANQPPIQSINQQQSELGNQPQIQSYNNPLMKSMKLPSMESYSPPEIPSYQVPQTNSFKLPIVEPYKPQPSIDSYKAFDSFNPQSFNPAPNEQYETHLLSLDQLAPQQNVQQPVQPIAPTPLQTFEQSESQPSESQPSESQPSNPLREGRDPTFNPSLDFAQDEQQSFDPIYSQFHAPLLEPIPSQSPPEQTFEDLYKTLYDPETPQDQPFEPLHLELPREESPHESTREESPHESPREESPHESPREESPPEDPSPEEQPRQETRHEEPLHEEPQHEEPPHQELPREQVTIEPFEHGFDEPFHSPLESLDLMTNFPTLAPTTEAPAHEQPTEQQQDDVKVRPQVPLDFQVDYGGALNVRRFRSKNQQLSMRTVN